MAPVRTSGRRGLEGAAAERVRARLVERGVYIEPEPSSAAKRKVPADPAQSLPLIDAGVQGAPEPEAPVGAEGQGGPESGQALAAVSKDAGDDAPALDALFGPNAVDAHNADGQAPEVVPADAAAGARAGAAEGIADVAAAGTVPMAGTAVPGPITASVTLTSEEEEELLADTVGEQPPEDPRAVAVWEVRRELDEFERLVRAQRQSIQERLAAAEEELRAQRRAERVNDYARLGLTLSRVGLGWEAVAALRDVPAADLLTLVHTLAERGLSVQDLLNRVPPAGR